ncbi:MAG: molybdopterin-dependent oxidoreductase, partial [Rubrivivax sp.]
GAKVASLNAVHDDWLMPIAQRVTAAPSGWMQSLADIACAVAEAANVPAPLPGTATDAAQAALKALCTGQHRAVLLGNAALQHPQAQDLLALAGFIAQHTGARVGCLGEAANSVGAQLVNALPGAGGLSAAQMLAQPRKALLMLNVEPVLDMADAQAAHAALAAAELAVAFTSFKDAAVDGADVLLPIAPFSETAGTFVNAEGRAQGFVGVVPPLGDTRPAWKVLRVLGNLLGLPGFGFESADAVRSEALGDEASLAGRLNNAAPLPSSTGASSPAAVERLADVPIYATDALVRRAESLQQTADARPPVASLPEGLWQQLGLADGDRVRIGQGQGHVVLKARLDATLAHNTVRVPAGHPDTASLGAMFGTLDVTRVAAAQGVAA